MTYRMFAVSAVFAVCIFCTACNREVQSGSQDPEVGLTESHEPNSVDFSKSLEAGNPYLAEYSDMDRELLEMLAEDRTAMTTARGESAETMVSSTFNFMMDRSGWILPQSEMIKVQETYLCDGMTGFPSGYEYFHKQFMVPEQWELAYNQQEYRYRSEYFPQIPRWLGTNPGRMNRFFPNGFVAVLEGLDEAKTVALDQHQTEAGSTNPCNPCGEQLWYYYDQDGEFLTSSNNGMIGIATYNGTNFPAGTVNVSPDGYITISEEGAVHNIKAIYDYDGTKLDPEQVLTKRDMHFFRGYSRSIIHNIFIYQQQD